MNQFLRSCAWIVPLITGTTAFAAELDDRIAAQIRREYPSLLELYRHLHANPELSFLEEKTAARVAEELEAAGFSVTRRVGGHGVVAIFRNGNGPTLMIRSDLDGLPVREETGLAYASKARAVEKTGAEVDVMHACGHDVHMTTLVGVGRLLVALKDQWRGTLLLIAQPAEERGAGARAMLQDGLFTRFPVPNHALALHVAHDLEAGSLGFCEGYAMANVDSVDITIRGVGGHGAYPHTAKDPIVIAAQTILALQTIVSREMRPIDPAVVTVGSIKGGEKHNIIPAEVKLQLTLRSYTDEVRQQVIEAVKRIVRAQAESAGVPSDRLPEVVLKDEFTPALFNEPGLTRRLRKRIEEVVGVDRVATQKPVMGGEDFGEFSRTKHKVPLCMFYVGAIAPELFRSGRPVPSVHSPFFAPDPEPTLKTAVTAMTHAALLLLGTSSP